MKSTLVALSVFLAVSQAASVLPIDSSSVNVKHSGQDFAYSIQETHGVAVESGAAGEPSSIAVIQPHQLPVTRISPGLIHRFRQENPEQVQGETRSPPNFFRPNQEQVQEEVQTEVQSRVKQHEVERHQSQVKAALGLWDLNYGVPIVPDAYNYLPLTYLQHGLGYPYGIHYPNNVIAAV